ncbi:CBO0543 family protein [Brevibacillus migulae]|uniref:CBO0543 family protein n=1 Tax=Brevibacillus migulae TaxID=1644114 RepID=UPI00196A8A7E|nr:CBO0543 family protein [Brevibacillus migulae]
MTYQEGLDQIDRATQRLTEANQMVVDAIINAFLFTWQWWVAFLMLVVPWVIWWIFRDRESAARLFSAGLLVMVLSEILDTFGVSFGSWAYPVKVIPVATLNFSFRLSLLPVLVMFLLQVKPSYNPYIKAVFLGGLGAYVGLPMLAMMDLYKKINWAYTYSFFNSNFNVFTGSLVQSN